MRPIRMNSSARLRRLMCLGLALGSTWTIRAEGQVAVGDSLWQLGRIDEASQAYRRALAEDRTSIQANEGLARSLARRNALDSALVFIRVARERSPRDPDLLLAEARYLSWAQRFAEAIARYDTVITAHPGTDMVRARIARARVLAWSGRLHAAHAGYLDALRRDPKNREARLGLAQVAAWSGDLEGASVALDSLLAEDPTDLNALIALANTRSWQGRVREAETMVDRAAALDSANPDVRAVRTNLRSQRATKVDVATWWSEDSELNRNTWQTVGWRRTVGNGIRLGASAGYLEATDPLRRSARSLAEVSVGLPLPGGSVTAAVGARALDPADARDGASRLSRHVLTGRLGAQARLTPTVSATASVARWPFDEVAVVTPLALDIAQWDLAVEWKPRPSLSVIGTNGQFDFSDGNRRWSWGGRGIYRLSPNLSVGVFSSGFTFSRPDRPDRRNGYFSPARFLTNEATLAWAREGARWSSGVSGGLGTQRIESRALQSQWHADARIARRILNQWQIELFAGKSTNAAASAVGAYDYVTGALTLRRAF